MTKKLTKQQKKELEKITKEIVDVAKDLVQDYVKNPSPVSGSIHPEKPLVKGSGVVIDMDSDYLKDTKKPKKK
jgi:hypothetical protein